MKISRTALFKLNQLKARAVRLCGISESQFIKLTPAEFHSIQDEALQELSTAEERENMRTARILAAIYNNNPNRKKSSKRFSEEDFLPKKKAKEKSAADLLATVSTIHSTIKANNTLQKK
jgi:hypothetical protein